MFGDASIVLRGTFVASCMHYSERLCMRLLLVEDNEELAQLLSQRVQAAGYEADLLVTAADALTAVMTTRYAAMVLDLGLPDGDGLSVLREIRQREDPLPVLVLTARGGLQDRVSSLRSGADDYLAKPFAFERTDSPVGSTFAASRPTARALASNCKPRIRHRRPTGIHRRRTASPISQRNDAARTFDASQGSRCRKETGRRHHFWIVPRCRLECGRGLHPSPPEATFWAWCESTNPYHSRGRISHVGGEGLVTVTYSADSLLLDRLPPRT
jgi:CheY-like chemotaxis protein